MLILCRLDMSEEVIQNDPEKSENFDQDESTQKKFLKRPEREACWRARDIFWDCLTFNKLLMLCRNSFLLNIKLKLIS